MATTVSQSLLIRTSDTLTDAELVARALSGDRWGREALYRRHAGSLLAMAARLIGNRGEAEEVVQDTFVTGFDQLATLRDPQAFRAWMGQIAVSLVRRRIRRARLLRWVGLDRGAEDATLAALAAPDLGPDGRTELALVDRVLRGMRAELRIAWMLRKVEGLELTEVAAWCGCSLATVKRRIREADEVVGRHVGHAGGEP
jgi:RNA polymerase sigma-70 factor (ECF subfamily)